MFFSNIFLKINIRLKLLYYIIYIFYNLTMVNNQLSKKKTVNFSYDEINVL